MKDHWTVAEYCAHENISRSTFYRMLAEKKVRGIVRIKGRTGKRTLRVYIKKPTST